MQPHEGPLDDPPGLPEASAVRRLPEGQDGHNTAGVELASTPLRIKPRPNAVGSASRLAAATAQRGNPINEGLELAGSA
jgi:hypothetical protein